MADTVKHTKGPWLVRPHWSDESRFEVYPDREVGFGSPAEIADVCAHSADDFDKEVAEAKANANLIAAAPDILEALHLVGMSAGWQYLTMETRSVIEAAIAKAEGRS